MAQEWSNPISPSLCPYWIQGYDLSRACLPHGGLWFLHGDEIRWAGCLAGLEPAWINTLTDLAKQLTDDKACTELLWHWHRGLIDPGGWTVDAMASWPHATEQRLAGMYALLVLSGVRRMYESFTARDIAEEVIRETLHDVRRAIQVCLQRIGCVGVMRMRWLTHHLTHCLIELGRLQFEMGRVHTKFDPAEKEHLRANPGLIEAHGLSLNCPVLWVHIPGSGPMTPRSCDEAIARATTFFPAHFPDHRPKALLCRSWLLDRQLAEYLPPTSNIRRFQERYEPISLEKESDEIQRFVFGQTYQDLADAPQNSALEKAIVRHLQDGGVWHVALGRLKA